MNSMSVVTPNRLEMKHSGGNNITKGVATITGQCNSSTIQLAQLSVFWWEDPLCQGPVQQEERFTRQDIIGENERNKMKGAIMTNVWLWVFDTITFWVSSITMQSLGYLKLLFFLPKYIPLFHSPHTCLKFFFQQYISQASGHERSKTVRLFVVQCIPCSLKDLCCTLRP